VSHDHLDDVSREADIRDVIRRKPALREFYDAMYRRYQACAQQLPSNGTILELGSGGGYAKEFLPRLITSDVLPYDGVDRALDATNLPYDDRSLSGIFMLNTFHHIPDVEAFLHEATRCLVPGGRVLILDQHVGPISWPVLNWFHHEPFEPDSERWQFDSSGPLSGANGALAWIVFQRDLHRFEVTYPGLKLREYRPHSPLFYWMAGGMKSWSLISEAMIPLARRMDELLCLVSLDLGSFVDIELMRLDD